jgi:hypothetical protein
MRGRGIRSWGWAGCMAVVLLGPARGATVTDAQFAGAVTPGLPEALTGDAALVALTTAEGTFTNLQGAVANAASTANILNSIGATPANAGAAVSGLAANDGINNLASANFQFTNGFDANTRFFILESTPQSSTAGDPATVTLIDAGNNAVGTYSLALLATNFTHTPANTTTSALATVTYTTTQATPQQKLSGVMFALADFAGSGSLGNATGIRVVSASVLDPNVVGMTSTTGSFPPPPAPPPPAPPGRNILFVGNSYTHGSFEPLLSYNSAAITDANGTGYGGVPGIFKKLTVSAGLNYNVTIEAVSSQTLAWHHANKAGVVFQPQWHQVFLQELSTGPLPAERGGNLASFQAAVGALEQGIHAANPRAEVFLYETFPRSGLTYVSGQPYYGEPIETMGHDLHDGYYGARALYPAVHAVSPAGDAWLRAIQKDVADRNPYDGIDAGKVNLWAGDNHHASAYGCFLNALVHFGAATGHDPRSLGFEQTAVDLGIASNVAVALQQMAFETLTNAGTRPMVTLNGSNPVAVALSASYTDAGASARDVQDGVLAPVVTLNTVVPDQAGSYTVRWEAVNSAGLTGSATRLVTVVDTNRPALAVFGTNGDLVAAGDLLPGGADGTDFGAMDLAGDGRSHAFTITNSGQGTLSLTGAPLVLVSGPHAAEFTVSIPPPSTIAPGGSGSFTIRFQPAATGLRQATVALIHNDPGPNPYAFAVQGTGTFDAQAFPHQLPIRFCGYGRSEVLTNLPVLLVFSAAITNFDYGTFRDAAGGDLRFTDEAQTRLLPYEIERWDTTGTSHVWVQVPELVGDSTSIRACWGNAAATNAPAGNTNGAAWSGQFAAVWHLAETSGPCRDATAHGLTAYPSNDVAQASGGQIAGGDDFGGIASRAWVGSAAVLDNLTNNFTVSAWIRPDVLGGNRVIFGSSWEAYHGWSLRLAGAQLALERLPGGTLTPGVAVTAGQWAAVAVAYDSSNQASFYLNGLPLGTVTGGTAAARATDPWSIGANSGDRFDGLLDQVEISQVARSSNWIWAAYQGARSNSAFACYGPVLPAGFPGDADRDGLPDAWETRHGLDPNSSNAPNAKSDDDWMTDFEEYVADTSPTSGMSFFPPASGAGAPSGTLTLSIDPTSTGRVYGIVWTTNLLQMPQLWTGYASEATGTGSALSFLVTNDVPGRIYRTGVRLP